MSWQVVLVLVITVVVAGGAVALGALLSRERRRRRKAEAGQAQMEGVARRLLNEREAHTMTDKEASDVLSEMLGSWRPDNPPGVPRGSAGG